jgi:oligopeptide/dipeptide ABC transporter ATP-binding protein
MNTTPYIIEAQHLQKKFGLEAGFFAKADRFVYAVNDVSFGIPYGKTYGLVGESGCGKTTTARLLVRMYKADGGSVIYTPRISCTAESLADVGSLSHRDLRAYREKIKYVFQDPSRSLNPRMNVFDILTASYRWSPSWPGKKQAREEAAAILEETGLDAADLERRPSEFSGGQRQRISIARGLIMKPDVLICDEVVSALDVSVQGQILNMLQDIRERRGLSFLFIAHDLRVSSWFCDVIGVMYRGVLVEEAPAFELYKDARHPYTQLLFAGTQGKSAPHDGEVKSMLESVHGCPFAHRCSHCTEQCRTQLPPWKELNDGGESYAHKVRCWL